MLVHGCAPSGIDNYPFRFSVQEHFGQLALVPSVSLPWLQPWLQLCAMAFQLVVVSQVQECVQSLGRSLINLHFPC